MKSRQSVDLRLDAFLRIVKAADGIPDWESEVLVAPGFRGWRFDRAWPELRVALEIEGHGIKRRSGRSAAGEPNRHTSYVGYASDCRKYTAAALLGWKVLRFVPEEIGSMYMLETLRAALLGGGPEKSIRMQFRAKSRRRRGAPMRMRGR